MTKKSDKKPDNASGESTGTAVATQAHQPQPALVRMGVAWDPFALMDRLDADSVIAEMQGIASDVLVYKIKDGAKETIGLSKAGVDECCTMLVTQGQCIREEDLTVDYLGEGENKEAIFKVKAARFAVHPDGREVRLDQVLGVKREPLYEQRAPLTLDSKVPGRKWRHLSFRDAVEDYDADGARGYLEWIVSGSTFDDDTKAFVSLILDGEDVTEFAMGKRFNNFWFEHGAMKAARNARFRLIPAGLKAQVVAMASATPQKMREVERAETAAPPLDARADTSRRLAKNEAKVQAKQQPERDVNRREPDRAPYVFPFGDLRGVALDLKHPKDHERAGQYVVGNELLARAAVWAEDALGGKPFARAGSPTKMAITDAERPKFTAMRDAMHAELDARADEDEAEAARAHQSASHGEDASTSTSAPTGTNTEDTSTDTSTSEAAPASDATANAEPATEPEDDLPF
jgi:hypothetical protein